MTASDIFIVGKKIILGVAEGTFPLRFHPVVRAVDDRELELDLPPDWWKITEFKPGTEVRLSTIRQECIFALSGQIRQVQQCDPPTLRVRHNNRPERIQRRTFYRIECSLPLLVTRVSLPEGGTMDGFPAMLMDVSAGGIGFRSACFLPPNSVLEVERPFEALIPQAGPQTYRLEVCWCRTDRPSGYRIGAVFKFNDLKETDQVAKIVNRLQIIRLSRYSRILQNI